MAAAVAAFGAFKVLSLPAYSTSRHAIGKQRVQALTYVHLRLCPVGVLRAVQAVLNTLAQVLMGPPSNPGQLIQGLAAATGNVLGVPGDAAAGVASNPISNTLNLINTAQGLLGKLLKP